MTATIGDLTVTVGDLTVTIGDLAVTMGDLRDSCAIHQVLHISRVSLRRADVGEISLRGMAEANPPFSTHFALRVSRERLPRICVKRASILKQSGSRLSIISFGFVSAFGLA